MSRALVVGLSLVSASCLKVWDVGGPFACADDGSCAAGLTCDDGVCCRPGGSPACPTLAVNGACADGSAPVRYYRDRDGDGFGDPAVSRGFCGQPRKEAWVLDGTDCDDTDDTVNPRATERCNGVDDNCNGDIDEGTPRTAFYLDTDGDGFGDDCASCAVQACARPKGYAPRGGDCKPNDAKVFPGAPERCNNVDDNCNGQVDDPPFIDVESPGSDGGVFACLTGLSGACSPGGLQCVYSAASSQFEVRCVPRAVPSTDLCDDGVDQDCDGVADNPPGCGGPPALVKAPLAAALAEPIPDTGAVSKLPPHCLRGDPDAGAMAWLNPSWIGNDTPKHTWALEAAPGQQWDLSRPGTTLHLVFRHTEVSGSPPPSQLWGDGATWFRSPVITLCGVGAGDYKRWVPKAAVRLAATSPFAVEVPVAGAPSQWDVESGGTLDLHRVKALEVTVSPVAGPTTGGFPGPVTFRITFSPDAGFY